mmetsp:Transcript_22193/g.76152  ORF Transcript_22193/g.76152 Transcript_22193/m.76152 type:complete len:97 (+) Transcript_22193:91-381(+)
MRLSSGGKRVERPARPGVYSWADLLTFVVLSQRSFFGVAAAFVALLFWLAQHEGHLTEFALIVASLLAWAVALWFSSSFGKSMTADKVDEKVLKVR